MPKPMDIERAIADRVIDPQANRGVSADYGKVTSFIELKGRPSRPIDTEWHPRAKEDFQAARACLPADFFEPFDRLLKMVGRDAIAVTPDAERMKAWNNHTYIPTLVGELCRRLDDGNEPLLVPRLVSAFLNLEREIIPRPKDWARISAITVPGSRTYDRAAQAFRAYLQARGQACIVCSGNVPYYDTKSEDVRLTEAEANAAYLRLLGVPDSRIIQESIAQDTAENVQFLPNALTKIEEDSGKTVNAILLVTSPFHLARYWLTVKMMLAATGSKVRIFAMGSKASRYWAETYFLTDAKAGYTRESTMGVVFNEYVKIAFDLCVAARMGRKADAARASR